MVHHALYQKQNYSYAGIIEALSGAPFEVSFLSFDDILADPGLLKEIDVIINVGDGDTAHTGGAAWQSGSSYTRVEALSESENPPDMPIRDTICSSLT